MSGRKRREREAVHGAVAERQAQGFRAGADMALAQLGPILMRRYFVRGMLAGAALTVFAGSLLWLLAW